MSQYTSIQTKITDKKILVNVLRDIFKEVEVYEIAQNLHGYQSDVRSQKAEIIIRKQFVGKASNDIGFFKNGDYYQAFISEFDKSRYNDSWIKNIQSEITKIENKIKQEYAYNTVKEKLLDQGFEIDEELREGGEIRIKLSRIG